MRRYDFTRGTRPAFWALALVTSFCVYTVIAQCISAHQVQRELAWFAPLLAAGWFMHLRPVRRVLVGDSEIMFETGYRRASVSLAELRMVRPWLNLSATHFVLEHAHGSELLMNDPSAVALLVRDLKILQPNLIVRGVPDVPGGPRTGS